MAVQNALRALVSQPAPIENEPYIVRGNRISLVTIAQANLIRQKRGDTNDTDKRDAAPHQKTPFHESEDVCSHAPNEKAQRTGDPNAWIATMTLTPGSLERLVRLCGA
jgi:hypothetical protein